MNLAWCTDIHLDFLEREGGTERIVNDFTTPLSGVACDGFVISGDISLANDIVRHLRILDEVVKKPVYFVLGNHDFYGGSFDGVRSRVRVLCSTSNNLRYLTGGGVVSLTPSTAIVGDDGWYDALHGDPFRSQFVMTDWFRVSDYLEAGAVSMSSHGQRPHLGTVVALSRKFAVASANRVLESARVASQSHSTVLVITHVPPWPKVHMHGGEGGDNGTQPWYTSKLMGDAIEMVAAENPGVKFEVFCGHTHGLCSAPITGNVTCHVGGAKYGDPRVQGVLQIA